MTDSAHAPGLDLTTLATLYRAGDLTPSRVVGLVLDRIGTYPDPAVWTHLLARAALLAQARALEERRARGEALPLYGAPFAVKDNIDVAGHPTTAACPAFAYVPRRTAPVVTRLLEAGALLVGKTNLDQFATGLAGDRSPFGACRNAFDPEYVSGGSSSGSAIAVAAGLVSFALGTDTAGSGRVPAGCNNIVGLKPGPGLLSTEGVVPACPSLDCVSILGLTADDTWQVLEVAAGAAHPGAAGAGRPALRRDEIGPDFSFAVPADEDREFCGDDERARLFGQSLRRLEQMGGRRAAVAFRPFREVAALLYEGPWLAERLANLEGFLKDHADAVYPVTRSLLEGGAGYSAADVFKDFARLRSLRGACLEVFDSADVLVVPTMPALPTLAAVQADSLGWSRRLGFYTNFVNLLQLAAVAVPAGFTAGGLPAGITLIGPAGSERRLCALGMAWQRRLGLPLGATGAALPPAERPSAHTSPPPVPHGYVRLAVAGAHLRGQPLHPDLRRAGARFVRACRTAPRYRFVALMHLDPPRPGLLRDEARVGDAHVEVYDLPLEGFGAVVAAVAPPLAIGTVELADGEAVKGYLCESWAAARARDITDFGGWVAFLEGRAPSARPTAPPPCS